MATKSQRRKIALRNLRKARSRRWKGHRKPRKMTKAQRRRVALKNLKKAWRRKRTKAPKQYWKKIRVRKEFSSRRVQKRLRQKIRYLIKKEGRPHRQAVAIAYSMARRGEL